MDQTHPTHISTTHALLIGVNDYKSFDKTGCSDLKGSRNDVVLLASYCVEVLGIPPENIVALTTPKLTDDELAQNESLRGVHWGDADEKEVTKRLASLLHVSKKGRALLTFSGHGAALPGGEPVLCLGDTAPGFTHGVLSLKTLGEDVENAGAKDRLVALLDCCHVASPSIVHPRFQGTALLHEVATKDVVSQGHLFRVSDRVLLAAWPGKLAYQVRFGNLWNGAFTFALVTAAEQWKGENEMSHGAYKRVLKRAKRTLKALGVPQKPEFRVPESRWVEIRNWPFLGVKAGPTQRKPDALKIVQQLDPNYLYMIYVDSKPLAQIAATGTSPVYVNNSPIPLSLKTEYWYVDPSVLASLGSAKDITIFATALLPAIKVDASFAQTFQCGENRTWSSSLEAPKDGTSHAFSGKPADPSGATATYVLLNVSTSGAPSLAHVQWYLTGLTSQPDGSKGGLNPGSQSGIRYSSSKVPTSGYWAAASR